MDKAQGKSTKLSTSTQGPHPPKGQKTHTAVPAAVEDTTPKNGNSKRLAYQDLQIKRLKNLIVELQSENEKIKVENRALKQVQVLLQHKTKDEKTAEELTAQYIQDTNVLQEQLRRYKKQLQTTEQMIVAKDERDAKLQSQVRKEEESLAHMKELLSEKGLETKDDLLRELNKVKKLAQAAEEKAAVVERKADLINRQHQKTLLEEEKKSAEAVSKVIYLMETVQDFNRRLMVAEMVQRKMGIYPKAKAEFDRAENEANTAKK